MLLSPEKWMMFVGISPNKLAKVFEAIASLTIIIIVSSGVWTCGDALMEASCCLWLAQVFNFVLHCNASYPSTLPARLRRTLTQRQSCSKQWSQWQQFRRKLSDTGIVSHSRCSAVGHCHSWKELFSHSCVYTWVWFKHCTLQCIDLWACVVCTSVMSNAPFVHVVTPLYKFCTR